MNPRFTRWATGAAVALSLFAGAGMAQASSLTSTQVSAILSLLESFGAGQGTINSVSAALGGSASANASCLNLSNNLTLGSSGSDVTSLQNYLIGKGDLTGTSATGYYGYLTASAVGQLQISLGIVSSQSDSAYGIMGPKTRAAVGCGSTSNGSTIVMPTSTPVPTITSSSLQTYSNSQYGFSFQYPSDFSVVATPVSNRAKVTATGQQLWGSTYPAPQVLVEATVDPTTVATCNSENLGSLVTLSSLSLIMAGVNVTPTLGTQTIGGVQFRSASMAADIKGVFASFTIYAALHNGVCYIVAAGLTGPDPATQNQSQSASPVVLPTVAATIAAEENAILQSFNFSTPTVSAQSNTSSVTASIDSNSLTQNTGTFSLTGSAANSGNVTVFLSAYNYGSVSYSTMQGQIGKDGIYQYSAAVSGGRWSAAVTQGLSNGTYYVQVYDTASQTLLTTGTLTVNGQTSASNTTTSQQSSYAYVAPNLFITPSIGSAPLSVTVYPNATPYAYSNGYSIDYGDGSVVQCGQICQPNTHTYSTTGVYTAKLEGLAGGTSVLATATVTVSAPSSATPVTTTTTLPQPVINSFSALTTTLPPGQSTSLSWNASNVQGGGCYLFSSVGQNPNQSITPSTDWGGTGSFAVTPSVTTTYTLSCSSSWKDGSPTATQQVTVSVAPETLTISTDVASPSLQTVAAGSTGVTLGTVDFAVSGSEAATMRSVTFQLVGKPIDLANQQVSVYNGSTLLGTLLFTSVNGTASLALNPALQIASGSALPLTIKANIASISSGPALPPGATSGDTIAISATSAQASGVNSGAVISATGTATVLGVRIK